MSTRAEVVREVLGFHTDLARRGAVDDPSHGDAHEDRTGAIVILPAVTV